MENLDLEAMPLDDLWALHEQISIVLSKRILAEKRQLEDRLTQLNRGKVTGASDFPNVESSKPNTKPRRPYPRVFPKYQNPAEPSETWSGRGKQPRWLKSALKAGGAIEDFKIQARPEGKMSSRR